MGVDKLNGVEFASSKIGEYQKKSQELATKDAKEKAKAKRQKTNPPPQGE